MPCNNNIGSSQPVALWKPLVGFCGFVFIMAKGGRGRKEASESVGGPAICKQEITEDELQAQLEETRSFLEPTIQKALYYSMCRRI